MNKALLTLTWRTIKDRTSPWATLLRGMYGFMAENLASPKIQSSYLWKGVCDAAKELEENFCWKAVNRHDGSRINIILEF